MKKSNFTLKKRLLCIAILSILILALLAVSGCSKKEPVEEPVVEEEEVVEEEVVEEEVPPVETLSETVNYFTGEPRSVTGPLTRPAAVVIENSYYARPQWGMDDETLPPDIILEGEVEGGITRMLWFYADYTNMPDQIGPLRSARPPYIRFSEFFDSIYIHWGLSHSKGDYVGADKVFRDDEVDHIGDGGDVGLYGRDNSRDVDIEHTGIMYCDLLPEAIEDLEFRTEIDMDSFTILKFNGAPEDIGGNPCSKVTLVFSDVTASAEWYYNEESKKYTSEDYQNDVARDNILVLMDNTEYVYKDNYGGSGSGLSYCDYLFDGGKGIYANQGKSIDITWKVEEGKLVLLNASGEPLLLNPGKTWIGWGSANNGGSITVE